MKKNNKTDTSKKKYTLIAEWDNGVKREFKGLDRLNLCVNRGELILWCEERKFVLPKFTVIEEGEEQK